MKNRPIFITIKTYTDEHEYSIAQIQNVTPPQVNALLGLTSEQYEEYKQWSSSIKKILIADLSDAADTATVAEMKAEIHEWVVAEFPDYEVKKEFSDQENRMVIFYLDGYE